MVYVIIGLWYITFYMEKNVVGAPSVPPLPLLDTPLEVGLMLLLHFNSS